MTTPPEKVCSRCNRPTQLDTNFCPWCGAQEFEVDSQLPFRPPVPEVEQYRLRLSIRRIIAFGIVSLGLYLLYWAFFTWDQLKRETGGNFSPPWHALSLLVPIYNLFRMHHHVRVIKELCESGGVQTNLSPPLVIAMLLLSGILDFIVLLAVSRGLAIGLSVISLILTVTIIVWAQNELNAYWSKSRGEAVREAGFSPIEWIVGLIGILSLSLTLIPFELP